MKPEPLLPEITVKAIILGVILTVLLAGANAYLGLFAGMTVSASIPAAVISMGVLRLFRRSNILENNLVQTAASAGESLAAGVIFTLPALVMMGFWKEFDYLWVTLVAGLGGVLGVLFTIPLRRALILEAKLTYPEGVATAEVLKTGHEGSRNFIHIIKAAGAGAIFKLGETAGGLWINPIESARYMGNSIACFSLNVSPALLSVGYIAGLNIAVLIMIGGIINWWIAIPICAGQGFELGDSAKMAPAIDRAHDIWANYTRYIGVGAMVVGGFWAILQLHTPILSGIRKGLQAYQKHKGAVENMPRTEKDIPMKWVLILTAAMIIPIFIMYQIFVKQLYVSIPMAMIMTVAGFFFSAVAGYMAGLVGSSNNPLSGVTIATILFAALVLLGLMGSEAENGPPAAILVGGVVCCAGAIAGDNLQDLKAGHIVQATPWKQQIMQIVGVLASALIMAPILSLLYNAYGFVGYVAPGQQEEGLLAAVQAGLMESIARGVFSGDLPWMFIIIGIGIGLFFIVFDEILRRRHASFRTPVLAVAVGIYLPFYLSTSIFLGGLLNLVIRRILRGRKAKPQQIEAAGHRGLLFASGLITGEAIIGILIAIPLVIQKNMDAEFMPFIKSPLGVWPGLLLLASIAGWLAMTALKKEAIRQ